VRKRPKPKSVALVLALCALLTSTVLAMGACAHAPTSIQTDAGRRAYSADQVVARLKEVSDVVKAATPANIAPADAYTIIEWISGDAHATPPTTGIAQAAQAAAATAKPAARVGWQRVRPLLLKYPQLAPYADAVDALLQEVL
jgi:hypothetical protein